MFSIASASGALQLNQPPDFENPLDADKDNRYSVEISATENGGGSSVQTVTVAVTDESSISFRVTFPTPNAELGGDATEVTVGGVLVDSEDGEALASDFDSIDVNGVLAMQHDVDLNRWSAVVPVPGAGVDINARLRRNDGSVQSESFRITNQLEMFVGSGAIDIASNRAFLAHLENVVFAIDLATGIRTVFSGDGVGSGAILQRASHLTVDPVDNRMFAFDGGNLITFDLASGDRSLFAGGTLGSGPELSGGSDMVIESGRRRLLVLDYNRAAILSVDIQTGERRILSDVDNGSGPDFFRPESITVDESRDRAYVLNSGGVFSVNLSTGDRTAVALERTSEGYSIGWARQILVDGPRNRLYAWFEFQRAIYAYDLASGVPTLVSDESLGEGSVFYNVLDMFLDASDKNFIVAERGRHALARVDVDTGDREVISSNVVGKDLRYLFYDTLRMHDGELLSGEERGSPRGLYSLGSSASDKTPISNLDDGKGETLPHITSFSVIDDQDRVVWFGNGPRNLSYSAHSIDLESGERRLLIDANMGSGPEIAEIIAADANSDGSLAVVMDLDTKAIYEIDLMSGDRRLIADETRGTGVDVHNGVDIIFDEINNRALLLINGGAVGGVIAAVDLETGDRTTISSDNAFYGYRGLGEKFRLPTRFDYDADNGFFYVTNISGSYVIAVDIETGHRQLVSGQSAGRGRPLLLLGPILQDAENNRLYVSDDEQRQSLLVIDLYSGDRAIVSR